MAEQEITVIYWPGSPWASKAISYLSLRGLPFTECHQPITMPRPDLVELGIAYRRIPMVMIGKDVYCDTIIVLEKLEELFPADGTNKGHGGGLGGGLGGTTTEQKMLEKLLEKWTDLAVFPHAADCIPLDHPLVTDPKFIKDRTDLWGWEWTPEVRAGKRNTGLVHMKAFFDFLETTALADGREWLLGTEAPMLADIQVAWIFGWLLALESFPARLISKESHPKTVAWCDRYQKAVDAVQPKQDATPIEEVLARLAKAKYADAFPGTVEGNDPLGLKQGQMVTVTPSDTGFTAKETGKLDTLNSQEVAVLKTTKGGVEIRVHCPRWMFNVVPADAANGD